MADARPQQGDRYLRLGGRLSSGRDLGAHAPVSAVQDDRIRLQLNNAFALRLRFRPKRVIAKMLAS